MSSITKREALLSSIDNVIEVHAKDNPALLKDLLKLRTDIDDAAKSARWQDVAKKALQVATLIKFLMDHSDWPPPH